MSNESRTCLICGSSDLHFEFPAKCNADGPIENYRILRCQKCTVALTDPLPEAVGDFYNTGIYAKSGGRISSLIDTMLSWRYKARLHEINRFSFNGGKRLLDVGCGKGRFIASANKYGWQAEGSDVVEGQINAAQEQYNLKISYGEIWELGFDEDSFDVITAWHVMEHLYQPNRVLQEISKILCKNGLFVLEVPYQGSWQAKMGEGLWFHLDVPRHLLHYNLPSLQYLLERHNFEIQHVSTFSLELGYYGMLQTMMNRMTSSPNWFFQWLKRMSVDATPKVLTQQLIVGLAAAIPAVGAETLAATLQKGGVLRVVARKP